MGDIEKICGEIAATAEVVGTQVTGAAIAVMAEDLAEYPASDVLTALKRVRRECNKLTLAEIVRRIPGCWPGADEAWAAFPKDERDTAVVSAEASQAWGIALPLWVAGDAIGARMAFRSAYERLVSEAKAPRPSWCLSIGWEADGREAPIRKAIEDGKISRESVRHLLPAPIEDAGPVAGLITGKVSQIPQDSKTRSRLAELKAQIRSNENLTEGQREEVRIRETRRLRELNGESK